MSPIDMDTPPGASAPVLNAALLSRIYELNRHYLDLLLLPRVTSEPSGTLCPKVLNGLAEVPAGKRRALAAVPFTLYSLGFEDQELWRTKTAMRPQISADGWQTPAHPTSPLQAFTEIALFHAWHVAVLHPFAARVIYSLPDATAARLVLTPLWHLRWIAHSTPALLMPRWPTNPCFWGDLVRFATEGDERRLRTTQLLGSQLIAAELQASTLEVEQSRCLVRPLLSPRLRARRPRYASAVP